MVKSLACKQSRGFRCTRIRLEDGTLASQFGEAQARWLRFHAGNFDAKIQSEQGIQCCIAAPSVEKAPLVKAIYSVPLSIWCGTSTSVIFYHVSKTKKRLGAGEDCIPNEVLRAGGCAMAAHLGDLALKVWQQHDAPMVWRGGVMATVPKSGPQDMCESWRGVLTASTMGKAYAKKLRREILPYLEPRAHGSQYGGLPARNTEMATHLCQGHHAQGEV